MLERYLHDKSFRHQLSVAVTVGVLLLALLSSLASSWQGSRQIREVLRAQGEGLAESLARQSKLALLYDAAENADAAVGVTLAFPDITRLEIRHADGRPLLVRGKGDQRLPERPELPPPDRIGGLEIETDDSWQFVSPVMGKEAEVSPFAVDEPRSERLGYVRLVQSKATLRQMTIQMFAVNFGTSFLAAFVLLLLIRLLTQRLMRPLTQLAGQMARAEQGESGVRAATDGPPDIAEMAQAFNSMIVVLEQREQQLRQAHDEAVRYAHLKAEFAATVSHEIRTPLNGVIGTLDILMATSLPDKQHHFVELAWNSSQYLLDLINNILDFSKLEAGRVELEHSDFSPNGLIEDVIELLAAQTQKKGLELSHLVGDEVPARLNGDPGRLRQVLTNLIGNAIKFTEQGEIVVQAAVLEQRDEDWLLRFEVRDNGIGIDSQAQAHIFESFAQADSSTNRRFGGSGLGLSICRQLVNLMGGEIGVESAPGKGSRFWFTLPLGPAHDEALAPTAHPGTGRGVVLVDESPVVRDFLAQSLSALGFRCLNARHTAEAMAILQAQLAAGTPCELLFMDSQFTSAAGGDLVARIRADADLARLRIVAMNRFGLSQPPGNGHIDAWLSKPLRLEKLRECIATLDAPSAGREIAAVPAPVGRCRILVAEDNRTNQAVAESMLLMLGCHAEIVGDGHAAIHAFQLQAFDLILMDCNMPHMDGYQATAAIRALEAETGRRIPIVAMTANVQQIDVEKCLAAGMDDHLAKPLTLGSLGNKLARWSKRSIDGSPGPSASAEQLEIGSKPLNSGVFNTLREALGDSLGLAIQPYLEDLPKYLETLEQAAAAQDGERLRQAAHAIKGASGTLGAAIVSGLAREIEALAEVGQIALAESLLTRLHAECALVKQALLAELRQHQGEASETRGEEGLVLVVDDDRSTRSALRQALERSGFQVSEAADGEAALASLADNRPDVILMDGLMPVLDGFSACSRLQEMPEFRDIPVLMITALEDNGSIERAFAVGASDYITKPIHLAVVQQRVRRVIEANRSARHVRHLAYHDTTTDLPNRAQFTEQIKQAIVRAEQHGHSLALLFLDLDRFKFVNDTLGHETGDRLLKLVGQRLRHSLRSSDCVARLGGDEFTVLLDELPDATTAATAAQKIERALANHFDIDGHDIFISASIGISLYPIDGNNASVLLRHADTAMYRAKRANGGFQFYEAGMDASVSEHLRLESALRRALEREELRVYYQPVAEVADSRIVGMEALLRWQHPSRGMVSPADFIPLAEETGLIIPIGEWVLRTACGQAMSWLNAGNSQLQIAVNLSSVQLGQANFVELVGRILAETGLPARHLVLEITESVLMEHAHDTVSILHQLKTLGVHLSIDDFGTGYSSLAYLKRFPVDTLKIDYSFTRDVTTDPDAAAIVTGIVALAHSLRLEVVAEGVETETQQDFYRQLACRFMQGYYLSPPVPAREFEMRFLQAEGASDHDTSSLSSAASKAG
ncbi:EAL domain-containing protein [Chitinimonas arctica]|uniref:Virulence sensor protein BvgS n=1 Tax=Chitinimonas arctica TaxID=2594795 RepID=A0A516SLZ1_9NEIS|nr:EAL domain-containing protein [Chitinimonas arctica]